MNRFNIALRMLWRDIRFNELTLLILPLINAVTNSTAILMFANLLQDTMTLQDAEFLAADLVVSSPAPAISGLSFNCSTAHSERFIHVLVINRDLAHMARFM